MIDSPDLPVVHGVVTGGDLASLVVSADEV